MKLIVLLISFLLFNVCTNVTSQEYNTIDHIKYSCFYDYKIQQDSTDNTSIHTVPMILHIGSQYSRFVHPRGYVKDSIINSINKANSGQSLNMLIQQTNNLPKQNHFTLYSIIKNLKTNETDLYEYLNNTHFMVKEQLALNWTLITNKDTKIAGFKCHQANTCLAGRIYTAWYTLQIPISDGPYKFKGLPGLIIKINDVNKEHCWELTSFKKINYENSILLMKENYTSICMEEYIKAQKNYLSERIKIYSYNERVYLNNEQYAGVAERLRKRNNFIEKF